jgi:N,N-dimethylformamidase
MTPLAAYASRLSVRPGQTIQFHASGPAGATPDVQVHRVLCADPNPEIGGVQTQAVDVAVRVVGALAPHDVPRGSYAVVERSPLRDLTAYTFAVRLRCTRLPDAGGRAVIANWAKRGGTSGATLTVCGEGHVHAELGNGVRLKCGPIAVGDWYCVALSADRDTGAARLHIWPFGKGEALETAEAGNLTPEAFEIDAPLTFAGALETGGAAFNGCLERLIVFGEAFGTETIVAAVGAETAPVALWDFARETMTSRIVDTGPDGYHGRLVHTPTRAMRGASWDGSEMCWRHAPEHYGAIHFHEDDVDDCGWPVLAEFTVPEDFKSGQYALMLSAGDAHENVPFWVVPPQGKPSAKIAVLISTFTYTIYANHARPEWRTLPEWQQAWRDQAAAWGAYPHNPGDHHDLGWSTYNAHTDGSGIAIASWHRPMLNVRLGYLTYPYPEIRASGLRHYPTDTHLTMWLDAKGYDYDVITDFELHHEGHDLLDAYQVVMTGTHPEYHTRQMLDALTAYRDGGGRFCYLGGNGFYWKIALDPERDGVIEIRRAEGGIRAWAAEPGEYYNQFDGEYGGLWRRNGRPPQVLSGVGFSAQGNFVGSHYRVLPDARESRAGWILDGVTGETFGGHGFSGHGAAGFELDRADKALGTPRHAVVLAASEDHPPEAPWVLVPEERLTHLTTIPGESDDELIRADMVFFETAGGKGAVFSTGSITYCGSLPSNGFDNDVSRVTENVLRRFLDPAPFEPAGG